MVIVIIQRDIYHVCKAEHIACILCHRNKSNELVLTFVVILKGVFTTYLANQTGNNVYMNCSLDYIYVTEIL